ncbi:molecular chaperone DnaJ [Enterovibrio norvegicus FF-33]|uniref:Molecular chaperone DnaJ n=1 Tax=Enterovibrio norvegicus FF-454 TaxID=1185651 RepID=A0A1E5BYF1_9GAMM|nr:DNA-J related domain-containing protein [Enterovibrio norvegicus]OEE58288.1 molecular chaperone DnaJ [Enterovibrio norvegicus FF-454]OEE67199.1 molecular chaperone DnaJ [Enterovibrio norvegicus FF-33]OEE86968.1 molecular chaperone DnaJ [Enterovibrio norvegicus FF-162]
MLAEQRDEIDNPLIWPILSVLEASNESWKVHYLMAELQKNTIMDHLDDDPQLDLFKRNFLIMNALYQLQETLLPNQWLQVESMDIRLMWRGAGSGFVQHEVNRDDPLREYYMDWKNYDAQTEDVRELLKSFWKRYQQHVGHCSETTVERRNALKALGLSDTASNLEIRRQWRKMALKWHPDRPEGDAATFRTMCEAWQSLRL